MIKTVYRTIIKICKLPAPATTPHERLGKKKVTNCGYKHYLAISAILSKKILIKKPIIFFQPGN